MKTRVDQRKCEGHKDCNQICPEVFLLDEWGYAWVKDEVVPQGLEAKVREAAEACPERAIVIFED